MMVQLFPGSNCDCSRILHGTTVSLITAQMIYEHDDILYIQEEEFEKIHDADYPLGIEDLVSTSQVVNQLVLRSPLDFAYLAKNEGILRGTGEFFKIYFGQVNVDKTSLLPRL